MYNETSGIGFCCAGCEISVPPTSPVGAQLPSVPSWAAAAEVSVGVSLLAVACRGPCRDLLWPSDSLEAFSSRPCLCRSCSGGTRRRVRVWLCYPFFSHLLLGLVRDSKICFLSWLSHHGAPPFLTVKAQ